MFVIRQSTMDDVPTLLKLARMVYFINLPPDRDVIAQKVTHSRNCFMKLAGGKKEPAPMPRSPKSPPAIRGLGHANSDANVFMFTLEDSESGACLGTSQLIARMGGPGNPNTSLKLEKREMFSTSLQTGTSHIVARLYLDETGPTEIGGLILQPSSRGHKLGQFLSFVRFHFVGLHRAVFADRIIAEMMARITPDGVNLLWEYLGRRFIPLSYTEADRFCQYSREFIVSLFPREDIYLSLLPPEARSVVAEVGPETAPARRLLEKLGFSYKGFIDPFDGGPHLDAATDEVPLVRDTRCVDFAGAIAESRCSQHGIVSSMNADGEFRAVLSPMSIEGSRIRLPAAAARAINAEANPRIGATPTDLFVDGLVPRSRGRRSRRQGQPESKRSRK